MEYEYLNSYKTKRVDYNKLHRKILDKFKGTGQSVEKLRQYEEMLVLLDQKSSSSRAHRGVCDQLFNQTKNREAKSSVSKMARAYIENMETAKLCLIRQENKSSQLQRKQGSIVGRSSTFIHLQLIQISVYSKFTKDDILTYEIQPSNIPAVTLQNSLNPMLNHEFTFKLENAREFSVVIKESGIGIGQWTFPDEPGLREGEYHRLIQSENLTLEAKIKYLPKNSSGDQAQAMSEMVSVGQHRTNSHKAFQNLVLFEPFLNQKSVPREKDRGALDSQQYKNQRLNREQNKAKGQNQDEDVGTSIRNLYYLLVALIVSESLFCFESSIQFLDLILAFFLMGMLMDQDIRNYNSQKVFFVVIIILFILCIVKSFFGLPAPSFYYNNGVKVVMSIICAIIEVLIIIALAICINNSQQLALQRNLFFYGKDEEEPEEEWQPEEPQPAFETDADDIWQESKY